MRSSTPRLFAASLALSALCLQGCKREPPPPYVRVSGAAPLLEDLPPAPAHLVVFWAAWCEPCREESPALRALASSPPEGLEVVVFSGDESLAQSAPWLGSPPDPGLNLRLDPEGLASRAYGADALPTTFLVVNGHLVARFKGPRDWDSGAMRSLLHRLMAEPRR